MSQHHQVVTVQVDAFEVEELRMADVMGRVPQAEIVEVLGSEWARREGWTVVQPGALYRRVIGDGVQMEFQVGDDGEVTLRRSLSESVSADESGIEAARVLRRTELTGRLLAARPAYNRVFNEVAARALALALPKQAERLGYVVVEQQTRVEQEPHIIDVVLKLHIPERAYAYETA